MQSYTLIRASLATICLLLAGPCFAVTADQFDRFDAGVEGWVVGRFGSQPSIVDQSLLVLSTGGPAENGRMIIFNRSRWAGNYNALGSNVTLQMDLDPGATSLVMRIAVSNDNGSSWFVTNDGAAVNLEANSGVSTVTFTLNTADMVSVMGSDSLQATLDNVSELRILHKTMQADFRGDVIAASLTVDNILIVADAVQGPFEINQGIAGAWYNPATTGQGFVIDIDPSNQFIFVAWFTFETESLKVGAAEHRWLVAAGNYLGGTAQIPIFLTTMGRFDDPQPVSNEEVGVMTLSFNDCESGLIEYDLTSDGLQGEIPVVRAVPAAKELCLMLDDTAASSTSVDTGNVAN